MEKDYTIDQVAEIVQVHRKTVEGWVQSGELEAYQLTPGKKRYRVTPEALKRFREGRTIKQQSEEPQGGKTPGDLARVA